MRIQSAEIWVVVQFEISLIQAICNGRPVHFQTAYFAGHGAVGSVLFVFGCFADDPGSGLAGVLFAIMAAPVAAQLLKSISDVLKVGFELCATRGTGSRLRSAFDFVVDSESLVCHASSFPQSRLRRYPRGFQTAPLPKFG
jgi:hypothetical protein